LRPIEMVGERAALGVGVAKVEAVVVCSKFKRLLADLLNTEAALANCDDDVRVVLGEPNQTPAVVVSCVHLTAEGGGGRGLRRSGWGGRQQTT
jgi:hypothetical protein